MLSNVSTKSKTIKEKKVFKLKFFNSKQAFYILFGITIIFGFLSFIIFDATKNLSIIRIDYTNCILQNKSFNKCKIKFKLDKDWNDIVYLHYQLTDFYKNFLLFSQSYSKNQLAGSFTKESLNECNLLTKKSLLNSRKYCKIAPCGELPNFIFNDTFHLFYFLNKTKTKININQLNLVDSMFDLSFKNPEQKSLNLFLNYTQKPVNWVRTIFELDENQLNNGFRNQFLIAWLYPDPFSEFSKLYGKIIKPINSTKTYLKKGYYLIEINNNYPLWSKKSAKKLILSNVSSFGQDNTFFKFFIYLAFFVSFFSFLIVFLIYKFHDQKEKSFIFQCSKIEINF